MYSMTQSIHVPVLSGLALAVSLFTACSSEPTPASAGDADPQNSAPETAPADKTESSDVHADHARGAAKKSSKATPVSVTREGSEFEPPISKQRIPAGAWYCDMGTVHYARTAEGDGQCPSCGMTLVQKK